MKRLLPLFFLLSLLTGAYPSNMIQDPGFESLVATNWSTPWFGYGMCGVETWAAKDGTNGVAFYSWTEGAYGGFGQNVTVTSPTADVVYTFSIDGKAETNFSSSSSEVFLKMEFWDGEYWVSPATNIVYPELMSQVGTWNTYSLCATNANPSVTVVKVTVGGVGFHPLGESCSVFWDNAFLDVMDSSQPYLSLAGETSAYAPSTNLWTVTRNGGAIDSALTVNLTNSNPGILYVPFSVVIPSGQTSAVFAACGFNEGTATVRAAASGYQGAALTAVISEKRLQVIGDGTLYVGKTNQWRIARTGILDESLTVYLGVAPSSIVSVPATMQIAAGETTGYFDVVGLSPGSAMIMANAAGYQTGATMAIVSTQNLTLSGRSRINRGGSNEWILARTAPIGDSLTVAISNDHPECVGVPSSVTILAGSSEARFFVEGKIIGTALITASAPYCGEASRQAEVSRNLISDPGFENSTGWSNEWFAWNDTGVETWAARTGTNGAAFFGWNVGSYAGFGQNIPLTTHQTSCLFRFSIAGKADSGFACSNGSVRMVMEFWNSVSNALVYAVTNDIYAGLTASRESWQTFEMECTNGNRLITDLQLLVFGDGFAPCGSLSAAMWDDACLYEYDLGATNILLSGDENIYMGPSNLWTITRIGRVSATTTVSLSSSNPSVVSVPSSITFNPYVTSNVFLVAGVSTGTAVISAMMDGEVLDSRPAIVQSGSLKFSGGSAVYLDATTQCAVVRNGSANNGVTVSLDCDSSSSGSAHVFPPTVEMAAGSTSAMFMVIGLALGPVDITASAPDYSPVVSTFTVTERQLSLSGEAQFYQGLSNLWTVTRKGPLHDSLTVTLTQPSNVVVQIPSQVVIPAGTNRATFLVEGENAGASMIVADASGYVSAAASVTVLQNRLTLTGVESLNTTKSNEWRITRTGLLGSSLTVTLYNNDTNVVSLPGEVVIPAGTNAAGFFITGLSLGSATVTASATGFQSAIKTIAVSDNLLVDPGFEDPGSWGPYWQSWYSAMGVESWAARDGSNGVAFYCWASNAWAGFCQYVSLPVGDSDKLYIFSIDIKADPDFDVSSKSIIIAMELYGETGSFSLSNNVYDTVMENRGQWTRVSVVHANTNPLMENVTVYTFASPFQPRGGLCALMWDNARLTAQSMVVPNLELAGETNVFVGASNLWTVARAGNLNSDAILAVASDSPDIASVPSQVILPAGEASKTFWVRGLSNGTAVITASAGGFNQAQLPICVIPNALKISGASTLIEGLTNRMTVSRSGSRSQAVQVQLSSDNPNVVALTQDSVIIDAQADSAAVYVTGLNSGTATVTATASGFVPDSKANTVTNKAPSISASIAPSQLSLEWDGIPGQTYYLEEADSLTGAWTRLRGYYAGSEGVIQSDINTGTVTSKFYRLQTTITNTTVPYQ